MLRRLVSQPTLDSDAKSEETKATKCVTFTIDCFKENKPSKVPARFLRKQEERQRQQNHNLVSYTDEEFMLIADIMREASLNEIKHKAGRVNHKLFDASRRRMCFKSLKEQAVQNRRGKELTVVEQ